YLDFYPRLLDNEECAVELIYCEFLLREELGDTPTLVDYRQRFPRFAGRLEQQLEFHRALAVEPDSSLPTTIVPQTKDVPTPPSHPELPPPAQPTSVRHREIPGYEIVKELGQGGMGVVYLARHVALNRQVALKMILGAGSTNERAMARFRSEARAIAR